MSEQPDFMDPFEDAVWLPARQIFRRLGFEPVPPADLDDFQLPGRLWEFIYAMAGRRFYLHYTDHLSDRELYAWLHDRWLGEDVADIPPEAEWNCRLDLSESDSGGDPTTWLRYYAPEEDRKEWVMKFPEDSLPPHETPPFDRDRWLPEPPGIPSNVEDDDAFPFDAEVNDESDPLGLAAADAEIRAEKRREEQAGITNSEQSGVWERPIDQLRRSGVTLLPPDELTDDTLTAKLWELLHNLACHGFYALHSDHLSDRELYTALWQRGLRDDALLPGRCRTSAWFHDFIGSGSEEDNRLWLRFYASDEDRAQHTKDSPDEPMLPKEKPLYNRDWHLPKGPF